MSRSPRVEFSKQIKSEINQRAEADGARRCEGCGAILGPGQGQIDHKTPEWMKSATPREERRRLTAEDGWLLCGPCHQGKSDHEASLRGHVDRMAKRHAGKHKSERPFRGWRNFKGQVIWAKSDPRSNRRADDSDCSDT